MTKAPTLVYLKLCWAVLPEVAEIYASDRAGPNPEAPDDEVPNLKSQEVKGKNNDLPQGPFKIRGFSPP